MPGHNHCFTLPRYPAAVKTLPIIALVLLAACNRQPAARQDLDDLDRALAGNRDDPAVRAALNAQIAADPGLTQMANANALRPAAQPRSGALPATDIAARAVSAKIGPLAHAPAASGGCAACAAAKGALTLGELATRQHGRGCATRLRYSAVWSTRLPADLPLYPDARVIEAAGVDGNGCRLRVVSFESAASVERVIDWYYTQGTRAGYSADHEADEAQHVLGGTRGDAAFVAYVSATGAGSSVDFVSNAGR